MKTSLELADNLKTKYNYTFAATKQARIKPSKKPENRKGWKLTEYTAPGTPQQNWGIECKFATVFNQVHIMLNGKFTAYLQSGLWAEAQTLQ